MIVIPFTERHPDDDEPYNDAPEHPLEREEEDYEAKP